MRVFISADIEGVAGINSCSEAKAEVKAMDSQIETAALKHANGSATVNIHPLEGVDLIRTSREVAVAKYTTVSPATPSKPVTLRLGNKGQTYAHARAQSPGAALRAPCTVECIADDDLDIFRSLVFLV